MTKKMKRISLLIKELLTLVGEDPEREGLTATPNRAAQVLEFATSGYTQSIKKIINNALYEASSSQLVLIKNVEFYSTCEHHLLPFFGKCDIAYIPDKKIIGLSKIPRIINLFSRRLQLQENLTNQIADALFDVLKPKGLAVAIQAQHLCIMMRGIEKQQSVMMTTCMKGLFETNTDLRNEFYTLTGNNS